MLTAEVIVFVLVDPMTRALEIVIVPDVLRR